MARVNALSLMLAFLMFSGAQCGFAAEDPPPALAAQRLADAIASLGSEEFATREAATRALMSAGAPVLAPLKNASAASTDPEVKARITGIRRRILSTIHPEQCFKLTVTPPESIAQTSSGEVTSSGSLLTAQLENIADEALDVSARVARVCCTVLSSNGKIAGKMVLLSMLSSRAPAGAEPATLQPGGKLELPVPSRHNALWMVDGQDDNAAYANGAYKPLPPGKYKLIVNCAIVLKDAGSAGAILIHSEPVDVEFAEAVEDPSRPRR